MNWNKNGYVRFSETDLAVLRSTAFADQGWADPGFWKDACFDLPPVYAPVLFTLLYDCPNSPEGFWISHRRLLDCSNHPEKYYRCWPLKTGNKVRPISAPCYPLVIYQNWILRNILEKMKPSSNACAYIKGSGLRAHALRHRGRAMMVKLDIQRFFDSVTFGMVYRVFIDQAGYTSQGAALLANLCCLNGRLPQGAATSPALSNLCMRETDEQIQAYCEPLGITYTRYSDDMIFSADCMDPAALIGFVRAALKRRGFRLNAEKTRILGKGARHRVTGVVCNEKLQADSAYRRRIRQEMHFLDKFGPEDHLRHTGDRRFLRPDGSPDTERYLRSLQGRVAFVLQISPEDREFREYAERLRSCCRPRIFSDFSGPEDGDLPF